MAGIIKVDRVQSDSNLAFNIAGANVAFMDASALRLVGSGITANGTTIVSGGRVVTAAQPTGAVLQVQSTTKTTWFSTNSTSWTDVTGFSVTITPSATTSKILVTANLFLGCSNGSGAPWRLMRDSTPIAINTDSGITYPSTGNFYSAESSAAYYAMVGNSISHQDTPSTTSTLTYKIQMMSTSSGYYAALNRRTYDLNVGGVSSLTVMEIAG